MMHTPLVPGSSRKPCLPSAAIAPRQRHSTPDAAVAAIVAGFATLPSAWAVDYTWGGTSNTWTSNSSRTARTRRPPSPR